MKFSTKSIDILTENLCFTDYVIVTEEISNLESEIERLNNIINEFEEWLEVNLINLEKEKANNTYDKGLKQGMLSNGRLIKNKLRELRGDKGDIKYNENN